MGNFDKLKENVLKANKALVSYGLVIFTWGNASEIDREKGVVAIKPSGVSYDEMSVEDIVVTDLDGNTVEGELRPSSDLKTFATAWAQAGREVVCSGTTHADYFYGPVPVTRALTKEETEDYERISGAVIAETFEKENRDYEATPAVLLKGHAPFTWGKDAISAAENAAVLEEVCKTAFITREILSYSPEIEKYVADKHYFRKHGSNAYYGQKKEK